jgi:hypothetical protein
MTPAAIYPIELAGHLKLPNHRRVSQSTSTVSR